ncbi:DUF4876 domain-containing protein [Pedobacter sp. MC2016-14]|uniref:DUF4876 domain-containing protein n=1 Tax=Pedobacter sp. MC2016-14 TaxID=2897327 RepID=UPI001E507C5A|nr:DUF4876 domain-containing protein [Pedobacter sp. MC2016-14]MCD0489828.1 DUF4876 domain-containing protein [Pedobacter sp. MC2016-14]
MRKSIYASIVLLAGMALGFQSCKKSGSETPTVNYTVKVTYPETYAQSAAKNATVVLTNSTTNAKVTVATNASGEAAFTGLLPGNYQIAVSRALTPTEGLTLTGLETQVFLNASVTNQIISADGTLAVKLQGGKVGGLVFKQVFYNGTKTATGNYFVDQFYEIYNNSPEVIYADSLYIGESGGFPGSSTASIPFGFSKAAGNVYLQNVFMIPGTGKSHPILPGQSIVISNNAINHKTDASGNPNSIDLGSGVSDFEAYVASTNKDVDNPVIPNMDVVYYAASSNGWIVSVFGASLVIFKTAKNVKDFPLLLEPGSTNVRVYMEVPGADVLDAFEALANANAVSFKRFPSALDAGFVSATAIYSAETFVRKVSTTVNGRRVLQDTNNSSVDFERTTNILPKGWR